MKVGDIVEFKTHAINGKWEIKKIKNDKVKLAVPNTNEELGMWIEIECLELKEVK